MNNFVMVIDDSAIVRKIVETCLRREGFVVKSFPDGIEALRWLTQPGACVPALVFLDINMPKADGYRIAGHLKSKPAFAQTVIIMLTRRNGVIDRFKARISGAKHYMTKPFTIQDIVAVTYNYLGAPQHHGFYQMQAAGSFQR